MRQHSHCGGKMTLKHGCRLQSVKKPFWCFFCFFVFLPEHSQLPPVGFQTQMICLFAKCPSVRFQRCLIYSYMICWKTRSSLTRHVCVGHSLYRICMYLMPDQADSSLATDHIIVHLLCSIRESHLSKHLLFQVHSIRL